MNNQKRDFSKYHRTLKLTTHFGTEDQGEIPRFLPTSYWEPEDKQLPESLRLLILENITMNRRMPGQLKEEPNLTKVLLKGTEISNNQDTIIKPADRGSSIVIMDKYQYLFEGMRQFNNTTHYRELDNLIFEQTVSEA